MIICPNCGGSSTEVNTQKPRQAAYIWRSRTCKDCGKTFSTREYTLEDLGKLINEDSNLVTDQVNDIIEDLSELISNHENH